MKKLTPEERAKKIKLVLMDVDGVLTDCRLYFIPSPQGIVEVKGFNALDGIGLRMLRTFGITAGLITGRACESTVERARMLCIKYVYQGFLSKVAPMEEILAQTGLTAEETAYIGDDWTDIPVMRRAGLACAPSNAAPETKKAAHLVTKLGGGEGAVREVCDFIVRAQGHWPKIEEMIEKAQWDKLPSEEMCVRSYK
jgi:3-deoxy-D-manno-octulosonate 8-phosphate phosphatase (KDO 8-P phosphatase)